MRKIHERLTLGVLLATLPVFCILAMAGLGLVVRGGMLDISARLADTTSTSIPRYEKTVELQAAMAQAHTKALRAALWSAAGLSADRVTKLADEAKAETVQVGSGVAALADGAGAAEKAIAEEIKVELTRYTKAVSDAVDLIDDLALATMGFRKADQSYQTVRQKLDAFGASEKAAFLASIAASESVAGEVAQTLLIAIGACIVLVGVGVGLISRAIAVPIKSMTRVMGALAAGRLSETIPYAGRRDDIGRMAQTLGVFRDGLAETERMRAEQSQMEKRQQEQRRADMMRIADSFEQSVGNIVATLGAASTDLTRAAERLSGAASKTVSEATEVTTASEQASHNVSTVAAATEELSASVREIGEQVIRSSTIIEKAAVEARQTTEQVRDLSQAADQIDGIVSLISDIATQTNLLALNATIEAARAGEAGRGFAVVASEVKGLATQTAKATADITARIKSIQDLTHGTTLVIGSIADTIAEVNVISGSISAAVTEQGAATAEIAHNIDQAARGSAKVAERIGEVHDVAEVSSTSASDVLGAARDLARHSESLRREINGFLDRVRAA